MVSPVVGSTIWLMRVCRASASVVPTYEVAGTSIIPLIPFTDTLKTLSPFWVDSLNTVSSGSFALAPTAVADCAFRPVPAVNRKSSLVAPRPNRELSPPPRIVASTSYVASIRKPVVALIVWRPIWIFDRF